MAASIDHVKTLILARAKLIEKRRAVAKRDSITDRDEGFTERIVAIQAALDATDRAIQEEQEMRLLDAKPESPEEAAA